MESFQQYSAIILNKLYNQFPHTVAFASEPFGVAKEDFTKLLATRDRLFDFGYLVKYEKKYSLSAKGLELFGHNVEDELITALSVPGQQTSVGFS